MTRLQILARIALLREQADQLRREIREQQQRTDAAIKTKQQTTKIQKQVTA